MRKLLRELKNNPAFWIFSAFAAVAAVIVACLTTRSGPALTDYPKLGIETAGRIISGRVELGESLFQIFKKYGIEMDSLFAMREAAAGIHGLKDINRGQPYTISIDRDNCVKSLVYWINDNIFLRIRKTEKGFEAERCEVPYETRNLRVSGQIGGSLISSVGEDRESILLALKVADIFAWDIDFTSDLQEGDSYEILVEGLYMNGDFKKYGNVLSAAFLNAGNLHCAYRFEYGGQANYYDAAGNCLQKAFLKAPLSFRKITSHYSNRRFHPILRIYRPHHGVDYAAAPGTPVSATCGGKVTFAGRRGQYGNLVVLNHPNGYATYYGHLSRLAKGLRAGRPVGQGDVIGYVGATGLASGPHLHYEVRRAGAVVNPLSVKGAASGSVPARLMTEFGNTVARLDSLRGQAKYAGRPLAGQ